MIRSDEQRLLRVAVARGYLSEKDLDQLESLYEAHGEPSLLTLARDRGLLAQARIDELRDHLGPDPEPDTLIERPVAVGSGESTEGDNREGLPEFLRSWSRYRVHSRLGSGGMGDVYRAYDPRLRRFVALKFLHSTDPRAISRFRSEAEAQARVDHAHVCRVYEVGEVDEHPYIAMQQIEGETLGEVASSLSLEQKILLIERIASGLHAAHRIGLIHRDIKPGNILIERGPRGELHPYVVDFGLVRDLHAERALTVTGMVSGTPGYLSPEQAMGGTIDRRSDVYGLGVLSWELLAGRPLVESDTFLGSITAVLEKEAARLTKIAPQLPHDLATIVHKCLEKDPQRRYESARALAEDLRRYLEGEPVKAQRPSRIYLLRKRLTKNPAVTATAAAGLVACLLFAGIALRTQQLAEERAALAQRLGRETQAMESHLRRAQMLPRHDLTPERTALAERLVRIEGELTSMKPETRGPAHAALGRAALTLGDLSKARDHLERALQLGDESPDTRLALATALEEEYLRALPETARLQDPEARALQRRSLRRDYLGPAIDQVRAALDGGRVASDALQARIAHWEERYPDALEHSQRAIEADPWNPDLHRLRGRLQVDLARESFEVGNYDVMRRHLAAAGQAFGEALTIARSDARLHLDECLRREQSLRWGAVEPVPDELETALGVCRRVLEITPDASEPWEEQAAIQVLAAESTLRAGEDPGPQLRQALLALDHAAERDPERPSLHRLRGLAHQLRARDALRRGLDSVPHLDRAVASLRFARHLAPADPWVLNTLGNTLSVRAYHEIRHGQDPRPTLEQAIEAFETALEIHPDYSTAWTNHGSSLVKLAEGAIETGRDPTDLLERAATSFERAVSINASHPAHHNNRGNAFLTLADYRLRLGEDPGESLDHAIESYERALELRPGYSYAHFNLAFSHRLRATHLLRRGDDPSPHLDLAHHALDLAEEGDPTDPSNAVERARLEILALRHALLAERPADRPTLAARRALDQGLALNPRLADLHHTAAELARWQAELPRRNRADTESVLDRGDAACRTALAIHPEHREALITRAALLEARARLLGSEPGDQLRRDALEHLERAVEASPLLDPDQRALRERLEREV